MSPTSTFSTHAATSEDAQAVRMLLSATNDTFDCNFVTESGHPPAIIAAGGLTKISRSKPLIGPAVILHVIEPFRRQGVGTGLLNQLAARAHQRGAEALYATQRVELDGEAMQAWVGLGFSICETVEYHDLPLDQFEPQLAPLVDRMRKRGKIPAAARIVPLYAADIAEVARLHLTTMGGDPATLLQKLRGEVPGSFAPRLSKVLLIEDRVAGAILAHRESRDIVYVDANIVAPEIRGGWANVLLKLEATRGAIQAGIKKFVFASFDHYSDTRSFTAKMRGITQRKMVLMYLPLANYAAIAGGG